MSQAAKTTNLSLWKSTLYRLWNILTAPPPHLDQVKRAQSRFLASVLIASLPLTTLVVIINTVLLDGESGRLLIGIVIGPLLFASYRFARQGKVVPSTIVMLVVTTLAIYVSMFAAGSEIDRLRIAFLLLPLLFANIVLSSRIILAFGSANIVILVLLSVLAPRFQLTSMVFDSLFFYVLGFLMIYGGTWFRDRSDSFRRQVLSESEARYRVIFEMAHDAVFIHDQGTVIDVNPKFMELFEITREGLNNWEMLSRIKPDPRDVLNDPDSFNGQRRYEFEVERRDGSTMPIVLYAKPIRYQDRDMRMLVVHDFTAARQAEQRRLELRVAEERNQLLEQLMADMSHDLKTPLSIIRSTLAVLSMDIDQDEKEHQLDLLERQVDQFERFFLQILTISGLEHAAPIHFQPVNLNTIIENIVLNLSGLDKRKKARIQTDLAPDLVDIQGDSTSLRRAITNLVENSIHYSPDGVEVTVQTRIHDTDTIEIKVIDTGAGISAEDLPHIFNRYYRGQESRSQVKTGTGLGLAIVQRVVDLHHGEISVTSAVGEGTTFLIRLPVLDAVRE